MTPSFRRKPESRGGGGGGNLGLLAVKPFFTPIPTFPIKGEGVSQRSPLGEGEGESEYRHINPSLPVWLGNPRVSVGE